MRHLKNQNLDNAEDADEEHFRNVIAKNTRFTLGPYYAPYIETAVADTTFGQKYKDIENIKSSNSESRKRGADESGLDPLLRSPDTMPPVVHHPNNFYYQKPKSYYDGSAGYY